MKIFTAVVMKIFTAVVMKMVDILLAVATTMVKIFLWLAVGTMMEGTLLGEVRKSSFTTRLSWLGRERYAASQRLGSGRHFQSERAALGRKAASHWIWEGGESGFSAANLSGEGEKCSFTAAGEWQTFPV